MKRGGEIKRKTRLRAKTGLKSKPLKAKRKKKRRRPRSQNDWNLSEWKNHCDDLASLAVKSRDNWTCRICGKTRHEAQMHWAHIMPRGHLYFRHHLDNAICLCAHCHNFDKDLSCHATPLAFAAWFERECPELFAIYDKRKNEIHKNPKIADYREIAERLETYIAANRIERE